MSESDSESNIDSYDELSSGDSSDTEEFSIAEKLPGYCKICGNYFDENGYKIDLFGRLRAAYPLKSDVELVEMVASQFAMEIDQSKYMPAYKIFEHFSGGGTFENEKKCKTAHECYSSDKESYNRELCINKISNE